MGIEIEGVPMYNLVQGSRPGMPYHHKGLWLQLWPTAAGNLKRS